MTDLSGKRTKTFTLALFLILFVFLYISILSAQTIIDNGITNIDVDGDGQKDLIVKGYVDNISPHSVDIYTFYILKYDSINNKNIYNLVKINFTKEEQYYVGTSRGADCDLLDIRIGKFDLNFKSLQLIIGERESGVTYVDQMPVTFTYFHLNYDEDFNQYIYEPYKKVVSKNKYCNVQEAFEKELGL
jgi:hypothetical protein